MWTIIHIPDGQSMMLKNSDFFNIIECPNCTCTNTHNLISNCIMLQLFQTNTPTLIWSIAPSIHDLEATRMPATISSSVAAMMSFQTPRFHIGQTHSLTIAKTIWFWVRTWGWQYTLTGSARPLNGPLWIHMLPMQHRSGRQELVSRSLVTGTDP